MNNTTTLTPRAEAIISFVWMLGAIASAIFAIALLSFVLSHALGVANVDSDTGHRVCASHQHLVIDRETGEGDCFWDAR